MCILLLFMLVSQLVWLSSLVHVLSGSVLMLLTGRTGLIDERRDGTDGPELWQSRAVCRPPAGQRPVSLLARMTGAFC